MYNLYIYIYIYIYIRPQNVTCIDKSKKNRLWLTATCISVLVWYTTTGWIVQEEEEEEKCLTAVNSLMLSKRSFHYMYNSCNSRNHIGSYLELTLYYSSALQFPAQVLYLCQVWVSENNMIISLNTNNSLMTALRMQHVFCAVRTKFYWFFFYTRTSHFKGFNT